MIIVSIFVKKIVIHFVRPNLTYEGFQHIKEAKLYGFVALILMNNSWGAPLKKLPAHTS